ncbi:hypothetical protein POJ06DRAFT_79537 [Lipomyces tetrasporus]|uniref:Cytochrome c oxidase assembly protein COX20, mitochondrial n=1 Tax=Lipomyces tetrasporus TaxID=54092 RepID=A0AAD7QVG3_9ASCO|nr:uncharacterized protein POJ06DRAFT_79537 [Lipomyces tetrasporus]KAJ8102214.1 hypothetical protein POJ06DRAFT_79537 [Lipomyces tetrasporus]
MNDESQKGVNAPAPRAKRTSGPDVTDSIVTTADEFLEKSSPQGFQRPSWMDDEAVQEKVKLARRLDRGFINESIVKIVIQESMKGMFEPYEMVNIFSVPCIRECVVSSLSVASIAGAISWVSSRNIRRSNLIFLTSAMFVSIPSYFACKRRLGQLEVLRSAADLARAKEQALALQQQQNNLTSASR